ncbi:MAG: DUF2283 domain-containing protein [Planctomycetota bacterium]
MLKHPFLEVTYRKGKAFAGYLHLRQPPPGERCQTEEIRPGVLVDRDSAGEPLGIEFLAPGSVTTEDLRAIGEHVRGVSVPTEDLEPILAR